MQEEGKKRRKISMKEKIVGRGWREGRRWKEVRTKMRMRRRRKMQLKGMVEE